MRQKKVCMISGGKTSGFMAHELHFNTDYEVLYLFTNTGKEREETLRFLKNIEDYFGIGIVWLEAVINPEYGKGVGYNVVSFETAARNGEPYEDLIRKFGLPSAQTPTCTRDLKTATATAYLRDIGWHKVPRAIGIRNDEIDRISVNRKRDNLVYPLIEWWPTTKSDVNDFWDRQVFTLELEDYQGNCDLCFKKAFEKLIKTARLEPDRVKWWAEMEARYGNFKPPTHVNQKKPRAQFYRRKLTALGLLELAKLSDDEIKKILKTDDLSTVRNGCSESCEAF